MRAGHAEKPQTPSLEPGASLYGRVHFLALFNNGGRHYKIVVDFAVSRRADGGNNDTADLLKPARGTEVLGGAVPITSNDQWACQGIQGKGHGLEEVEVAFCGDPSANALEIHRSKVGCSFAHGGQTFYGEAASGVEVLGGGDRLRRGHANEDAGGDNGAGRLAASLGDIAWLDGKVPLQVSGCLLGLVQGKANRHFRFLEEHGVRSNSFKVFDRLSPSIRIARIICQQIDRLVAIIRPTDVGADKDTSFVFRSGGGPRESSPTCAQGPTEQLQRHAAT